MLIPGGGVSGFWTSGCSGTLDVVCGRCSGLVWRLSLLYPPPPQRNKDCWSYGTVQGASVGALSPPHKRQWAGSHQSQGQGGELRGWSYDWIDEDIVHPFFQFLLALGRRGSCEPIGSLESLNQLNCNALRAVVQTNSLYGSRKFRYLLIGPFTKSNDMIENDGVNIWGMHSGKVINISVGNVPYKWRNNYEPKGKWIISHTSENV